MRDYKFFRQNSSSVLRASNFQFEFVLFLSIVVYIDPIYHIVLGYLYTPIRRPSKRYNKVCQINLSVRLAEKNWPRSDICKREERALSLFDLLFEFQLYPVDISIHE